MSPKFKDIIAKMPEYMRKLNDFTAIGMETPYNNFENH